jgi:hypothetical protein
MHRLIDCLHATWYQMRLQVTEFAVEESVNESILSTLAAYGLEKLQGKEGNADVTQKVYICDTK